MPLPSEARANFHAVNEIAFEATPAHNQSTQMKQKLQNMKSKAYIFSFLVQTRDLELTVAANSDFANLNNFHCCAQKMHFTKLNISLQ